MKKILFLSIIIICQSVYCMAQEELAFPFKDGKDAMAQFFKDSLEVSPEIIQKKAVGIAVFKFTSDDKGNISKIIVYYADDAIFAGPIVDALKKSNHQWILPKREKTHDFIVPFVFSFIPPTSTNPKLKKTSTLKVQKKLYSNYLAHSPIMAADQIPLNQTTLLPVVVVSYDLTQ
jgi:hypothetical protein